LLSDLLLFLSLLFLLLLLLICAGALERDAGACLTEEDLLVEAFCVVVVRGAGLVTLAADLFVVGVLLTAGAVAAFLPEVFTEVLF